MAAAPIYVGTLKTGKVTIVAADTTTLKTVYTAGASGAKIENLCVVSDDTSARVLNLYRTIGGTDYRIGTVNIPIAAGTDGALTPAVSVLETDSMLPWVNTDSNGRGYLYLEAAEILKVASQTTVTAAKTITIVSQGGDL